MKNRNRSEIVRLILDAANGGEGARRIRLMYKSYLSFNRLREYLRTLQENGLIDYDAGKRCYSTTEKGIKLLQLQNKLEEIAPINYVSIKKWLKKEYWILKGPYFFCLSLFALFFEDTWLCSIII